jgi:hypothetical protein
VRFYDTGIFKKSSLNVLYFYQACQEKKVEIAKYLIEKGADVFTDFMKTPLHYGKY